MILFKTIWRLRVEGHENIPHEGGVIIAPNHLSMADPPLTAAAMQRPLYFMAKKELFDIPVLGFIIRRTNTFAVRRGQGDIGAFRTAQRLLEEGKAVLVFPKGSRKSSVVFPGVGMLSCMANVPVVPVKITNTDKIGKLKSLSVKFGKPIYPPPEFAKETYQKISEQTMEAIAKL